MTVSDARYEVAEEVSRGGMGRIRVAHDRKLERIVAVKELLSDTVHARARFEREAKITARLQHPAIIPVYDAALGGDSAPSYSMRLVAGRSLDAVMAEAVTLDARLALLPNMIAVADAVAYAHSQSIIHRDLKPANVLIGDFGETVVIDWGLAKDLRQSADEPDPVASADADSPLGVTIAGTVLGTPVYMSPEQARGGAVDERTDVYALGAMLYHLLAAELPRTESTAPAASDPPSRRSPVPRGVPRDLIAVVDKSMAESPADRYPTARELAVDLRRFQTGQLVSAHRYGLGMLIRRFVRRYRAAVVASALLIAAIAIVGVISVRRIQAERDVADTRLAAAEDIMQFMMSDLRDRLHALGKLELLESAGDRVDRYYRTIDAGDRAEGDAGRQELTRRIEARRLVGDVKLLKGDHAGALTAYQDQLALAKRQGGDAALATAESSLGDLLAHDGDAKAAIARYTRGLDHATRSGDGWLQANAQLRLGEAYRELDNVVAAHAAFQAAIELLSREVASAPADVRRRVLLADAQRGLGDVLQTQGDTAGSLAQLRSARDGLAPVSAQHPEDSRALHTLSMVYSRIGDLLRGQGDLRGALEAMRQSQAIGLTLAAREPMNKTWQRDVGIDHQTIATVLHEQGDNKAAAAEIQAARAVYESLVATDPSSTTAQESLISITSDEALVCPDDACAAKIYRRVVEMFRGLEARAPHNAYYALQRLHAQLQLADELLLGHAPDALAAAREAVAAAEVWAAAAPADPEGSLLVAYGKLRVAKNLATTAGGAREAQQLAVEALASFRAVPAETLRAEFHAATADELATAERLAHGK